MSQSSAQLLAVLLALSVACRPRAVREQDQVEVVGRVQLSRHAILFTPHSDEQPIELLFDWSLGTGGVEVKVEENLPDLAPGCWLVRGPRYRMPGFRLEPESRRGNGFGYRGEHERAIAVEGLQRVPCPE